MCKSAQFRMRVPCPATALRAGSKLPLLGGIFILDHENLEAISYLVKLLCVRARLQCLRENQV